VSFAVTDEYQKELERLAELVFLFCWQNRILCLSTDQIS